MTRTITPLLSAILLLYAATGSCQQMVSTTILKEGFNDNSNAWNQVSLKESSYEAYTTGGYYLLNLPVNNASNYGFTWVGMPSKFGGAFDQLKNGEFSFDLAILDGREDGSFEFGLMFDLHNITNTCPGGDFYMMYIYGNVHSLSANASVLQRTACNWAADPIASGTPAAIKKGYNHISIIKNDINYEIRINGAASCTFNFSGQLKISHVYYAKGKYQLDNIAVAQTNFVTPAVVHPNNANAPAGTGTAGAAGPAGTGGLPRIWALVVGVKDYPDFAGEHLTPLFNPLNDAKGMYDFWSGSAGGSLQQAQIRILRDKEATKANILAAAYNLYKDAGPDDMVVLYFSGHGGIGNLYAYDDKINNSELNAIMNQSNASKKVCIIDACFSGSLKPRTVLIPKGSSVDGQRVFYEKLKEAGDGITFLLSCDVNERSVDVNNLGSSLFTYYLLKGLNCAADADRNGIISVGEISNYVRDQVVTFCKDKTYPDGSKAKQTPQVSGAFDSDMPIGRCISR
jgi:hypothetical protein